MIFLVFILTIVLYAVAAIAFFFRLLGRSQTLERLAFGSLGLAVVANIVFVVCDYFANDNLLMSHINGTLATASMLISLGYLLQMRRHRLPVLGTFVVPIALLFLLGAGLPSQGHRIPEGIGSALIKLHIIFSTLGVVLFTLAFAAAVAYLIQETLLRSRQISGVFQRLPALDLLDTAGFRFVTVGFPLFTIGIILGSITSLRIGAGLFNFSASQGFALLAWLCFAFILLTRAIAGWRGRRAALGTVMGFLCAVATLLGYLLRNAGGW
ncbi:MAG: cytochrome c biogenesis protein CcsA [Deltaproteobacteria bacterium]|nr:cytochrome c biogenesis protein CcsA [Deltaproteobacteria bacterium]